MMAETGQRAEVSLDENRRPLSMSGCQVWSSINLLLATLVVANIYRKYLIRISAFYSGLEHNAPISGCTNDQRIQTQNSFSSVKVNSFPKSLSRSMKCHVD